tara:strand:+ start:217 stop:426 length:210 start_codon:yes stop_codon:yes gene_type:complete
MTAKTDVVTAISTTPDTGKQLEIDAWLGMYHDAKKKRDSCSYHSDKVTWAKLMVTYAKNIQALEGGINV